MTADHKAFHSACDVFDQNGVCVTDLYTEGDLRVGQLRVRWVEQGNRHMLNIFEYSGLVERRQAMQECMLFAVSCFQSTNW